MEINITVGGVYDRFLIVEVVPWHQPGSVDGSETRVNIFIPNPAQWDWNIERRARFIE